MYYVGLDVHRKSIAFCIKRADGAIEREGNLAARGPDLSDWARGLPQPWSGAMEATLFSDWVYDHLQEYVASLQMGHPARMRAIATAKKKTESAAIRKATSLRATASVARLRWPRCNSLSRSCVNSGFHRGARCAASSSAVCRCALRCFEIGPRICLPADSRIALHKPQKLIAREIFPSRSTGPTSNTQVNARTGPTPENCSSARPTRSAISGCCSSPSSSRRSMLCRVSCCSRLKRNRLSADFGISPLCGKLFLNYGGAAG